MKEALLITGGIESAVLAKKLASSDPSKQLVAWHYNVGRLSSTYELHFARRTAQRNEIPFEEIDFSKFWRPLLGYFDPGMIALEFDSQIDPGAGQLANAFPVTLTAAAFFAASVGVEILYAGLTGAEHAEHQKAYEQWTEATITLLGNKGPLSLTFPFGQMGKAEVIREGMDLGVNLAETWSCLLNYDRHCGECRSCYARRQGFLEAKVTDPTKYDSD